MTGALSATAKILSCRGQGERGRWGDGEMGRKEIYYLMGAWGAIRPPHSPNRTIIFNLV
jgi:hypothetical protein